MVGAGGILLAPTRSLDATHSPALAGLLTSFDSFRVGAGGIEPSTVGLKGHCSTN